MKPIVALRISLLSESLKFDFLNKNVLITEVFLWLDIWVNGTYFFQKGLPLERIVCEVENEGNGRLYTITITTQMVCRIL